ncbi:hypothetical protein DRN67_01590 [Candidatus Micrarchaeota archaeon]|nr:MAG: hypothetical protein DRN67_01590 [Candidatus Micrarchaeota archaeon]
MLALLGLILVGLILGLLTGFIPGLHPNTLAILLSNSGIEGNHLSYLIFAIASSAAVFEAFRAIFL